MYDFVLRTIVAIQSQEDISRWKDAFSRFTSDAFFVVTYWSLSYNPNVRDYIGCLTRRSVSEMYYCGNVALLSPSPKQPQQGYE